MFEDSDLLRRDTLVLRATAPPDAQFSVLDETGREIGRVISEGGLVEEILAARLVLYDGQQTRVLAVERHDALLEGTLDVPGFDVVDGRGQPVKDGRRVYTIKVHGGRPWTIRDRTKAEVGSIAPALPPEGDHRLGLTFLFTITAEVSSELRLGALAFVINFAEGFSQRGSAWMLKGPSKIGQAWPGSAAAPEPVSWSSALRSWIRR
jgi:hypothetical protein